MGASSDFVGIVVAAGSTSAVMGTRHKLNARAKAHRLLLGAGRRGCWMCECGGSLVPSLHCTILVSSIRVHVCFLAAFQRSVPNQQKC